MQKKIFLLHSGCLFGCEGEGSFAAPLLQVAGNDDFFGVGLLLPQKLHAQHGGLGVFPHVHLHRGQGGLGKLGEGGVVEGDDAHLLGHLDVVLPQGLHQAGDHHVTGGEDGVGQDGSTVQVGAHHLIAALGVHLAVDDQPGVKAVPGQQGVFVIVEAGVHGQLLGVAEGVHPAQIGDVLAALLPEALQHLAHRQVVVGHDAAILLLVRGGVQKDDVLGVAVEVLDLPLGEAADGHDAVQGLVIVFHKVALGVAEQGDGGPGLLKTHLVQHVFQHEIVDILQHLLLFKHLGDADAPLRLLGGLEGGLGVLIGLIALLYGAVAQVSGGLEYPGAGLLGDAQRGVLVEHPGHRGLRDSGKGCDFF